jgi:hypothetical protein
VSDSPYVSSREKVKSDRYQILIKQYILMIIRLYFQQARERMIYLYSMEALSVSPTSSPAPSNCCCCCCCCCCSSRCASCCCCCGCDRRRRRYRFAASSKSSSSSSSSIIALTLWSTGVRPIEFTPDAPAAVSKRRRKQPDSGEALCRRRSASIVPR